MKFGWNHEAILRPDLGAEVFLLAGRTTDDEPTTDTADWSVVLRFGQMRRAMSYRYERRREPRRRNRNGCLALTVALVWIILLAVVGYRYWLRPQISAYVGRQIAEQVGAANPGQGAPAQPQQQVEQAAGQVLPTAVAALPSGELRVSEEQANAYLAERADSLKPIDSATVRFVPDEVQVDLRTAGISSTARMGLAVQNGRIIAVEPRLDGPLSQLIALPDLAHAIEQQLNGQLAAQGRRVTDARVEQGALIVTIEG
jgi:hypothetical protein